MVSPKGPEQLSDEQLGKYIREIDECNNTVVKKLSTIVDKKQIASTTALSTKSQL